MQLTYDGFNYGPVKRELDREFPAGEMVLSLASVPILVPDSIDDKYCGPVYMIYSATTGMSKIIRCLQRRYKSY